MRKILILAIFGLMFALQSTANDVGVSAPDVGYEQQVAPVCDVVAPVLVFSYRFVGLLHVSAADVITAGLDQLYYVAERKQKALVLTAYRNPDYGLWKYRARLDNTSITQRENPTKIQIFGYIPRIRHVTICA